MKAADNNDLFEKQWRQAFDQAGMSPPPMVWHKIEATLATQKEGSYRKAIFFYRLAAAAMTTVAVGLAVVLFFTDQGHKDSYQLAAETSSIAPTPSEQRIADANTSEAGDAKISAADDAKTSAADDVKTSAADIVTNESALSHIPQVAEVAATKKRNDVANGKLADSGSKSIMAVAAEEPEEVLLTGFGANQLSAAETAERIAATSLTISPRAAEELSNNMGVLKVAHLYGVARPVIGKQQRSFDQPLLASLGVGAGSFNPNYSYNAGDGGAAFLRGGDVQNEASLLAPAGIETAADYFNASNGFSANGARAYNESYQQGSAFSIGGGIGKRIFRRLMVHAGLYYGRFNSPGTTNLVLNDTTSNRKFALNQASFYAKEVQDIYRSGDFSYRGEVTQVNNRYEFLTVPVKLGFILLDGRTGLVLNTGIASEIFLANKVKAEAEGFESIRTSAGESSPFRDVYLNGTLGLEFNYQIAANYKVVVEPYYRHALTTFTRNTDGFTSSPRIWGVQAGVRYELR